MTWIPPTYGGNTDPSTVTDPLTLQQDEVMKLREWPRSKQLDAYKLLHNLGIRMDDCDSYSIKRQFEKEQAKS